MPTVSTPSRQSAAVSSKPLTASPGGSDEFTRLHITPLDAELLKVIVPASALPAAKDISYHTIETFPEKRYGFVNLLKADADKLRAKLNGAVLKGCKIRIEKARPEKTFELADMEEKKKSKKDKKSSKDTSESSKKRKREDNVVDGVALSDRKVKRGWTETPGESAKRKKKDRSEKGDKGKEEKKKKRTKSKYTDQEECLLKTRVPSNAMGNISKDDVSYKKKKKGKGSAREVTVHEFEKTTKFPSFLKDSSSGSSRPAAAEYVEGKGWVDEDGNTVEPVTIKKPAKPVKSAPKKTPAQEEEDSDDTSSSGSSSSSSSSEDEAESEADIKGGKQAAFEDDSDTSSSGSSDDDVDENIPKTVEYVTPKPATKVAEAAQPTSSPTARNLTIKIPPPSTPSDGKVHPLEALYKRPKPADDMNETPAAQKSEPFTFFGGAEEEEEEEEEEDGGEVADKATPMPMTPFTRQEFEWRTVRSAAPTPDTAHPSRMQNVLWSSQQDGDIDDDMEDAESEGEEEEEDADGEAGASGKAPTSDFQAWFWENRRDLNQSWMKRRKTAAKEKRHRENKARASRAV